MSKLRNFVFASMVGAGALAGAAAAATDYTALRADSYVHDRLLGASIAYLIEENCPSISKRVLYGASQLLKLQRHGRGLGYTNKELSAYVDSAEEQDRFRAIVEPYLAEQGVVKGDSESYCRVGRAEIANGTIAGTLLRER